MKKQTRDIVARVLLWAGLAAWLGFLGGMRYAIHEGQRQDKLDYWKGKAVGLSKQPGVGR